MSTSNDSLTRPQKIKCIQCKQIAGMKKEKRKKKRERDRIVNPTMKPSPPPGILCALCSICVRYMRFQYWISNLICVLNMCNKSIFIWFDFHKEQCEWLWLCLRSPQRVHVHKGLSWSLPPMVYGMVGQSFIWNRLAGRFEMLFQQTAHIVLAQWHTGQTARARGLFCCSNTRTRVYV